MSDQIPLSPSTESDRVFDHTVVSATPDRHGLARPADALLSNISVSPVDPTAPNLLEQLAASTMALNHNIGLFQAHMAQQLEILQRLATDRAHYRTELEEMRPIVTDLRDTVDDRFKHLSSSAPYAESDAVKQPICSLWGCEYVGQVRIARSDTVCKAIAAAAEILPHWHDEWTEEARLSTLQHFSDTEFQQNANAIIPVYAAEMGIDDILARAEVQRFASLILGSGKWFDSRGELQDRPPTDMRGHAVAGSILLIDADCESAHILTLVCQLTLRLTLPNQGHTPSGSSFPRRFPSLSWVT